MTENTQKKTSFWGKFSPRMKEDLRLVVRLLASGKMLVLLLLVAVGVAGGLAYAKAWRPLQAEVQLPPGVPVGDPMIDRTLLQRLSEGLTIRRRHVPASYFRATIIFSPITSGQAPITEQNNDQGQS